MKNKCSSVLFFQQVSFFQEALAVDLDSNDCPMIPFASISCMTTISVSIEFDGTNKHAHKKKLVAPAFFRLEPFALPTVP